jgi:CRISPR-associated protein Csx10
VLREHLKIDPRAAIERGDIRVLNATIDVNGVAGRPVPFCLSRPKGKKFEECWPPKLPPEVCNGFFNEPDKSFRVGYIGPVPVESTRPPGQLRALKPIVGTHNVVEDRRQRPTEDVGGVYSFEAIAPTDGKTGKAVVLRTELRVRKGLADGANWTKLTGDIRLGVSKKDDYGEAVLTVGATEPVKPAGDARAGELFVWLLSDVLLRGAGGQPEPTVAALERVLGTRLGTTLKVAEDNDGVPRAFVRARRTESWHTGWGLPRPSLVGLQAGSCVKFIVTGANPSAAQLTAVERDGLGERTAEGFGQVVFNHPLLINEPGKWGDADFGSLGERSVETGKPPSDLDPGDTARHIEEAAWRESIRVAVLAATATGPQRNALFGWQPEKPNMSQLGGLRAAVQFLKAPADAARVGDWLKAVSANKKRDLKWPTGAIKRLTELIDKSDRVWAVLRDGAGDDGRKYLAWPTLTSRPEVLEGELWAFAVRALLDAAIRAHKRAGEKAD